MSLDIKPKHRYCGYCRKTIYFGMEDFLKHLDYCEMALVSADRNKKDEDNKNNGGMA